MTYIFSGSATQDLWFNGSLLNFKWSMTDMSDVLRVQLMYKYGGTYLDSDCISAKGVTEAAPTGTRNLVGKELTYSINNNVLHFEDIHHPLLECFTKKQVHNWMDHSDVKFY